MNRYGLPLVAVLLSSILAACVTTTTGPFTDKISKEKAVVSYVKLGYAYLENGHIVKAKKRAERALELDPENPGAHTVMALIWLQEGEVELTREHFEEAIDNGPNEAKPNHYYAEFLMSQNKHEQAIEYLKRVSLMLEYPDRPKVLQDLGECYYKTDQKELALASFKKSQKLDSSQAVPHYYSAELSFDKGEYGYAQRSFDALRKLIAMGRGTHTADSVYLGIRLARHFNDKKTEKAYVKLLYRNYRDTPQFQAFMNTYQPFLR